MVYSVGTPKTYHFDRRFLHVKYVKLYSGGVRPAVWGLDNTHTPVVKPSPSSLTQKSSESERGSVMKRHNKSKKSICSELNIICLSFCLFSSVESNVSIGITNCHWVGPPDFNSLIFLFSTQYGDENATSWWTFTSFLLILDSLWHGLYRRVRRQKQETRQRRESFLVDEST